MTVFDHYESDISVTFNNLLLSLMRRLQLECYVSHSVHVGPPCQVLESLQKAGCMEVSWRNRTYIVTRQFHDDLRDGGHDDFLASEGCDTMPVAAPIEVPVAAPVAAPIAVPVTAPVRLLHGMRDDTVLVDVPSRFLARLASQDVRLTLVKDADHQFSRPADITLMCNTLDSLL